MTLICRGPDQKTSFHGTTRKHLRHEFGFKFFVLFLIELSIIDLSDLANQPMLSNDFGNLINVQW